MATFLDVSGLAYFDNIFAFLFVWIVVYATLTWARVLGDNKMLNILAGLVLAILVLTSKGGIRLIVSVAPFLTIIFVLIVLLNIASKMLGGDDITAFPALKGVILVILITVILVGIFKELRDDFTNEGGNINDLSKTSNLFFHPKFIGTALVLAVSVFTVALLAAKGS